MTLLLLTSPVLADFKITIRQTVGGMTSESTTYVKGKRERSEQDFGGFKSVAIKQCDLRRNIQLNPMTKTYTLDSWAAANAFIQNSDGVVFTKISASSYEPGETVHAQQKGGTVTVTMSIRDTGERKQMFGYTARHIFVTTSMVSSKDSCNGPSEMKTETEGWYIDAEFDLDCEPVENKYDRERNIEERKPDCKDRYIVKNSGSAKLGFALYEKITMQNNGQPFVMVREVTELSKATLDQALFEIPADYREQKDGDSTSAVAGFDMAAINAEIEAAKSGKDAEESSVDDSTASKGAGKANVQDISPLTKSSDKSGLRRKDPNVIRIGIAELKSGEIGEGMSADILVGSIGNAFPELFEGTGIEIVELKAKLPSAIAKEAKETECDFFLIGTVSHKRDGGGFGFARSLGNIVGNNIPYGGGTAESVARQTASSAAYEIGDAASSVKAKDEITFQIVLTKSDGTPTLNKSFKRKAKSGGEDIISPILEEAADAIVTASQK